MTERNPKRYIITKALEPEGAYAQSLDALTDPHEEDLTPDVEGVVIKARKLEDDEVAEVRSRPHIIAVEEDVEDHAISPAPLAREGAQAVNFDQDALRYHQLLAAEERGEKGKGVAVGVGDTGIKETTVNARFSGRLKAQQSFVPNEGVEDVDGHGDFCCVAATPPEAELVVAKVLGNDGSGMRSWIIAGIDWMAKQGATVISLSLGGGGTSVAYDQLLRALEEKGVVVFAAAGNGGRTGEAVNVPANSQHAKAVAAINHRDEKVADFSNKGPEVDFSGAGVNIAYSGRNWSGTSMATPLVARAYATILGATNKSGARSVTEHAALALKTMVSTCRDTPAPVTHDGVGVPMVIIALDALPKPEPGEPIPEPDPEPEPEPEPVPNWVKFGYIALEMREKWLRFWRGNQRPQDPSEAGAWVELVPSEEVKEGDKVLVFRDE